MLFALLVVLAAPQAWVPARWPWKDPATLELASGTPVNCVLVEAPDAAFTSAAAGRGIATLAVIAPGGARERARAAVSAKVQGLVLEDAFDDAAAEAVRQAAPGLPLIFLGPRSRMRFAGPDPVIGTNQGLWPGIHVLEGGAAKAAPTGSPWIDTNSGFVRAARARTRAALWIANRPPEKAVNTAQRYVAAIADAAIAGARWVIALDGALAARLGAREPAALDTWRRMMACLEYFERHPEWREWKPAGKLALVQDASAGALLSGGILDMMAARHTPVRAVARERLAPGDLEGTTMAVSVDPESASDAQKEILRGFARGGGTLLSGAPGWKAESAADPDSLTLGEKEQEKLGDIWRDVQSMIGRRNLGVRLFNVSGMLSSMLAPSSGRPVAIHLVNYTAYPVESLTVHVTGEFRRARLLSPDGPERPMEVYAIEGGTGVDIDRIAVCATLRLE
jgi:hypothetical protein